MLGDGDVMPTAQSQLQAQVTRDQVASLTAGAMRMAANAQRSAIESSQSAQGKKLDWSAKHRQLRNEREASSAQIKQIVVPAGKLYQDTQALLESKSS